jgi:hypothetical protein
MSHVVCRTLVVIMVGVTLSVLGLYGPDNANAQVRPAVVKNVDEAGRIPFQFFLDARRGDPECGVNYCSFYLPAVPANKRLVITNVAMTITLDSTAVVQRLRLFLYDASYNIVSQFTVPYNPNYYPADPISANNPRRYVVNEQLLWFIEAGQRPLVDFHTTGGSLDTSWPNSFLITGYLVDLSM